MTFWLLCPDRCSAISIKAGEEVPCDKLAVAVAAYKGDEYKYHEFPVCKHHARGREMLSLAEIIGKVRENG